MTLVKLSTRPAGRPIDHILADLAGEWKSATRPWAGNGPAVNIHETQDAYHIELLAPGRNKEDFTIKLEKDLLTISYEKKNEEAPVEYQTIRREFSLPAFRRSFHLDEKVREDAIEARYDSGILKLLLPKKEVVQDTVKQINVQ